MLLRGTRSDPKLRALGIFGRIEPSLMDYRQAEFSVVDTMPHCWLRELTTRKSDGSDRRRFYDLYRLSEIPF
ncbi:hypothetical protein GOBAR_DD23911 [Gossypium barbadense]|nr:hypothetical protein GOBAR_DD23911 [Gossypium barbadense]